MSKLTLSSGVRAGFCLTIFDAFGSRFKAYLYGVVRDGWFMASRRDWAGTTTSVGPQALIRPRWREFLGLIKQAGFWDMPEREVANLDVITDDGEWLTLQGRVGDRYHEIHREGVGTPGLFQLQRHVVRWSGLFPEPLPYHPTQGSGIGGVILPPTGNID